MAEQSYASAYGRTYTSFGGADIIPVFNGRVIGECQALTFNVTREKAPVYTFGGADVRSFSRGKRGIAGSLVFAVFNRDALVDEMRKLFEDEGYVRHTILRANVYDWLIKQNQLSGGALSPDQWDTQMQQLLTGDDPDSQITSLQLTTGDTDGRYIIEYADQIPPFNITLLFANEYGNRAKLEFFGVEILNESMGFSVDDITTEKAYTFVCRRIIGPHPVESA